MENGHTLHLITRDRFQSQPSSGQNSEVTNGNNVSRGNYLSLSYSQIRLLIFLHNMKCVVLIYNLTGSDTNAGGPRARLGQISHSVVLGTFNVGDQAEGIVPDLTRVCLSILTWSNILVLACI